MLREINLVLTPEQAFYPDLFLQAASRKLELAQSEISGYRIIHKSIDARQRNILINLRLHVFTGGEIPGNQIEPFRFTNVSRKQEVIIVGSGPAGLFAALHLIENGFRPVIIERGKDVHERKKDIALLNRNVSINPDSNYCFGEGGAGTFSDGKLYTRSVKRGNVRRLLELLCYFGASEDILYDTHPHIGSDKLPQVIQNIREAIIEAGGEIHFNSTLTDFIISSDAVQQIVLQNGKNIKTDALLLATGHSARDVYEIFTRHNLNIEGKGFAMGVRVEHPQELINKIQYHGDLQSKFLSSATYTLATQQDGRGVYSFCMCPGGFIVPASTTKGEIVVNGMSASARNSGFANSGIVVEIRPEDIPAEFRSQPLPGLAFQQYVEQLAYINTNEGFKAPAQRMSDFIQGRRSNNLPESSYFPGLTSSSLHEWLPVEISSRLKKGLLYFDQKMKGYLTNEALLAGVESRTSSPVRIPRNADNCRHTRLKNLFPCGEGAGYSGGIVSSALDGINSAQKIIEFFTDSKHQKKQLSL
jgi:uncharacterized FAD-dependent dehydrogenase